MTARQARSASLGRGLTALIPKAASSTPVPVDIPVDKVERNPYQPRSAFETESLRGLAQSLADHGVLQPILVTETLDGYRLIAGERRLRAAQMAGLSRIPAVVRQTAGRDQLELALVENIQRADLNPLEEARAYRQLGDEFQLSHDEIAGRVGKARSTVANIVRLLELDPTVQAALERGAISEGHGRCLVGLPAAQQRDLASLIEARDLSVRQVEALARRLRDAAADPAPAAAVGAGELDTELERMADEFRRSLGTKVSVARSRRGGRIVIEWYGDEELDRLYRKLTGAEA